MKRYTAQVMRISRDICTVTVEVEDDAEIDEIHEELIDAACNATDFAMADTDWEVLPIAPEGE